MDPYSKRELDNKFTTIVDTLDRIESQTVQTNGRVKALERWQAYLTGALTIIAPLSLWALSKLVTPLI